MMKRAPKKKTEAQIRRRKFLNKLLIDLETSGAEIARTLNISRTAPIHFIHGDSDSHRIATEIARRARDAGINLTVEEILAGEVKSSREGG